VRINQLGYLPGSPKRATWVTDEPLPVEFSVVTADGSVALRGLTQPWPNRPEPTSGQSVHVLDFTDLAAAGPGYQLLVAGPVKPSVPNCRGPLRPTRPQRPGIVLPAQIRLPDRRSPCPGYGRPAGHSGVPPNQGDTAVSAWTGPEAARLYPGWAPTERFDVSGGWYDAGDYGKYTVSGSIAVWQLLKVIELLQGVADRLAVLSQPTLVDIADAFDLQGFDFDRVAAPARLDLAVSGAELPDHDQVVDSVTQGALRMLKLQQDQPWGQPYAPPDGWAWGSNGRILNNLVVLAIAAQVTGDARFHAAVITGIDYILGRNALGQSYVTGYGRDATEHLRTRPFGHDLDPSLPSAPPGALAGGANSSQTPGFPSDPRLGGLPPQCCYLDEPTSETTNDVCIRWNAPLAYIATYLSLGR